MTPPARRKATARERTRNAVRIVVSAAIVLAYAPIMVWAALVAFGGVELQQLFDWITGRCPSCSAQQQTGTLVFVLVLGVTLPTLALGLYFWVRRAYRGDRHVTDATTFFRTAPDRVPPATVGVDPVERRFYRDRQGRLRPMEPE